MRNSKGLISRRTGLQAPAVYVPASIRSGAWKAEGGVSESCPRVAACNSIAAVLRLVQQTSIGKNVLSGPTNRCPRDMLRGPYILSVHHHSAKHQMIDALLTGPPRPPSYIPLPPYLTACPLAAVLEYLTYTSHSSSLSPPCPLPATPRLARRLPHSAKS